MTLNYQLSFPKIYQRCCVKICSERFSRKLLESFVHNSSSIEDLRTANLPANIYLSKVSNRNTKRCERCPKLTIKILVPHQWRRSLVFNVNFEHISCFFLVFYIVDFEQVNISWVLSESIHYILRLKRSISRNISVKSYLRWTLPH